ncbi:hypothetical protein IT072_05670 [Leifsonia sp. ZF2019]|uniref:hypothetical protein n=1 Tax=Leifsonia sp. ZF2019 TaxID=2781978 RepID=UPI001CBB8A91|nr:hypothetical protein [Leifsonia sp. ZF2019]UAJ80514.1 hypothetical protein IT072_05670 [Leifsonia sp. ZF2019]
MSQDEPVMDGSNEAGADAKVAGIIDQVRADMQLRPREDSEKLLRQRLSDAGIQLDDAEISRIAGEVQSGPSVVD